MKHKVTLSNKFFHPKILIVITLLIISILLIIKPDIFSTFFGKTKPSSTTITASPTPKSKYSKPLPTGKEVFRMSFGKDVKGPKMKDVTFEPLDPKTGEKQTVTVSISHNSPVTSVKVTINSDDDKKSTHTLNRISGTDTDGVWQGSWNSQDTHIYNYSAYFELFSTTDSWKDTLSFR